VISGFLLDTNVPSELTNPVPDRRVASWVDTQENSNLYLSAVSVGEMRRGFALLPLGKRRRRLEDWFEKYLLPLFEDRILSVTPRIGDLWGVLDAERQLRGMPLNTADGMIAATARFHDLTVVTRNAKDFAGLGVRIFNPWD